MSDLDDIAEKDIDTFSSLTGRQRRRLWNKIQARKAASSSATHPATSLQFGSGQQITAYYSGSGISVTNHAAQANMSYAYQVINGAITLRIYGATFTAGSDDFIGMYQFSSVLGTASTHYGLYPYQTGSTWGTGMYQVFPYSGSIVLGMYATNIANFLAGTTYTIPQFDLTYII